MDKMINDFSIGLFIWQLLIFVILILGIFVIYKLIQYLNLKTKKLKKEINN